MRRSMVRSSRQPSDLTSFPRWLIGMQHFRSHRRENLRQACNSADRHGLRIGRVRSCAASRKIQSRAAPASPTAAAPGWAARCTSASRDAPLECAIEQTAILTKTGQLVVLVNIRVPSDTPTPVALVQLPLGINLPAGAKFQVDDAKAVDLQIQTCENRGCYAARAGRAGGAAIGQAVESVVPESGQGNHHHPDAAGRFRRRLRQDQVT
jgi:invasion protein IalB